MQQQQQQTTHTHCSAPYYTEELPRDLIFFFTKRKTAVLSRGLIYVVAYAVATFVSFNPVAWVERAQDTFVCTTPQLG